MKIEDICDILNSENENDVILGKGLFEVYKNESEILSIKEKIHISDLLCSRFKNPKAKWSKLGWATPIYKDENDIHRFIRYFNNGPISGTITSSISGISSNFNVESIINKNHTIEL